MIRACKPFFQFVESRFQRLFFPRSRTWGGAPGWNECAPLELSTNAGGNSGSAKGATLIDSLGQRPRVSRVTKFSSPAGAGRFIPAMRP